MRSGRLRSMRREETRPATGLRGRARAERLWQETVAQPRTPADDVGKLNVSHLPLSPSPEGGGGTQTATASSPSPPFGEERAGVRRGLSFRKHPAIRQTGRRRVRTSPAGRRRASCGRWPGAGARSTSRSRVISRATPTTPSSACWRPREPRSGSRTISAAAASTCPGRAAPAPCISPAPAQPPARSRHASPSPPARRGATSGACCEEAPRA